MPELRIKHFYHRPTGTLSYVVSDRESRKAAIIDPVLGFSVVSGRTDRGPAVELLDYLREQKLELDWILETHAHADHLSAAQFVKREAGGKVGIGEGIRKVQAHFQGVFNLKAPFRPDGSQFDRLFADGDTFMLGGMEGRVLNTPGHTSDSITYLIGDAAFVGDSLFVPDFGTARCDFPGGDAELLYDSIQKLFALPAGTRLFMCHDYPPESRGLRYEVTVEEQLQTNIHVGGGKSKAEFVRMRQERDATLNLPALILPSIQVNIRAGELPEAEDNGVSYLKIPLDLL
ncbi:MAG: MBL fold metallo-hydrolase [Gammaproteobacteria bacterium]|nr:MBL fold metallo-hydrolase [Gammaproteobacteria bacterium]MDH4255459.1 MBL fold metallo-hydrolase [Gammaproteobacteria bacterium]MDH5309285.1 MBL fold metallo-hydrolase [Gammaproteobacteria bacterium]